MPAPASAWGFYAHQQTARIAEANVTPEVRAAFMPHMTADGAHFVRPMHVRLLRRLG